MAYRTLVHIAHRWGFLLMGAAVLGGVTSLIVSIRLTTSYEARTTLTVSARGDERPHPATLIRAAEQLTETYSQPETLRPLVEQAIRDGRLPFDVNELQEQIRVTTPPSTQLIRVIARASDPDLAAWVANAVARGVVSTHETSDISRALGISTTTAAQSEASTAYPKPMIKAILGALIGLLTAGSAIAVIERIESRARHHVHA